MEVSKDILENNNIHKLNLEKIDYLFIQLFVVKYYRILLKIKNNKTANSIQTLKSINL